MATVRLADYLMRRLAEHGIDTAFLVTGGGAMHLNDALGLEKRIRYVCCHHEQACAMAAEGYARIAGKPALVSVTTGPGGINALNGVFGAWTDSIPMLVISGQVKRETCMANYPQLKLRQLGDQEADIVSMAKGITKYAVLVTEPESIRYHLERALYLADHGRPGPVWLDIPIDVQAAMVEPEALRGYDPAEDEITPPADLEDSVREIVRRLREAERPVILAGKGIRLAHAEAVFERVIRRLGVPVATAWTAIDLLPSDDPLHGGRPGDIGDRPGNFTVQNADLLLILGCRMGLRQVSYNWRTFARGAFRIQVDIDPAEMKKPTLRVEMPVACGAAPFLDAMERELGRTGFDTGAHAGWLEWCRHRVAAYPVVQPHHRAAVGADGLLNPYRIIAELFPALADDDVVVCGNGTANVVAYQAAEIRGRQRLLGNTGDASMGYDLPAAIGAAVARGGRVVCLAGDGSLQMNIQELQTVAHHQLPVKIFVLNNGGYLSIRGSQANFFRRFVGESPASGVSFPDIVKVAQAYGIPAVRIAGDGFVSRMAEFLALPGPGLCEVMLDPAQGFEPKLAARPLPDGRIVSPPLEDMFPFLSRDELQMNMRVPPVEP